VIVLTPEQRYQQAIRKARIQAARELRDLLAGKISCTTASGQEIERAALIAEIDRAYRAGYADARQGRRVRELEADARPTTQEP
jgi:hypothetical protein